MAASDPQDDLIPLQKLKQLVGHAEDEPLGCAFGLTKEKTALLLVDKLLPPKKVRDKLKKETESALVLTSLRFGTISIDKKNDPGTIRFAVNKPEVGGTVTALVRLARKLSYQAVVINEDSALDQEDEQETAGTQVPPSPPSPPPQAPAQAQPNLQALRDEFARLVPQIPTVSGGNPMLQQPLVKLAGTVQTSLKAGDAAAAGDGIVELRRAMAAAAEQAKLAAQAQAGGGAVTYAKSRLAWLAARKKVESEIEKLRSAILATYQDDGIAPELDKAYRERVAPVLAALDERLADKLDEATNATAPDARAKLVAEAREIMGDYTIFLNSDKTVAELDGNPFVPLSIQQTIAATLSTLAKAVH